MQFSENMTEISKALADAQAELKNPYNTADNPFYKSKYAPLPDVLNMIRPVLAKHGISVIQRPAAEGDSIGVETMLLHRSGQYILFEPYYLKPAKNDPQTAGGAITYARRYALNAVLGISGEEDDDSNSASGKNNNPAPTHQKPIICPKCGKKVTGVKIDDKLIPPADVLQQLGSCLKCYKEGKPNDE